MLSLSPVCGKRRAHPKGSFEGQPVYGKERNPVTEAPTSLDINRILEELPHRYPFLMVDRVVELEPGVRGLGLKNVTFNEPHFQGHFPGNPVMPGVLIVEALAQLGGIVVSAADGAGLARVGFLAGVNQMRFRRIVRPGDVLQLEVETILRRKMLGRVRGTASVNGDVAAEGEITFVFDS